MTEAVESSLSAERKPMDDNRRGQEYVKLADEMLAKAIDQEKNGSPAKAVKFYEDSLKVLAEVIKWKPKSLSPAMKNKLAELVGLHELIYSRLARLEGQPRIMDRVPLRDWETYVSNLGSPEPPPDSVLERAKPKVPWWQRLSFSSKKDDKESPRDSDKRIDSAPWSSGGSMAAVAQKPVAQARSEGQIGQRSARSRPHGNRSTGNAFAGPSRNGSTTKPKLQMSGVEKHIAAEIISESPNVKWDDVAGLQEAKSALFESAILPLVKPEIFTGLRSPAKGILLFGPPGNGKTFLAKAVASEANCTFFSISASSLTSKWVGEGEKLVRAMFDLARANAPAIVFIDEIDSVLTARHSGENEASRRLKTEFLVRMDGLASEKDQQRVLVLGATNRPHELDDAVRRRFSKRIYIPLPDEASRLALLKHALTKVKHSLTASDFADISKRTQGYSCADLMELCREAALVPVRELGTEVVHASVDSIRPLVAKDLKKACGHVKQTVSKGQLRELEQFNNEFGSYAA